jgi:hypothetical protein
MDKKKRGRPKKVVDTDVFKVSFVYPDHTVVESGATILECLDRLAGIFKGKCVMRVEYNGLSAEQIWYPARLRKLQVNRILRELTQKRFLQALK